VGLVARWAPVAAGRFLPTGSRSNGGTFVMLVINVLNETVNAALCEVGSAGHISSGACVQNATDAATG